MGFGPCNFSLKILESIRTATPKMGVHLGVWGAFPHTLLHSRGSLLAFTLASPCCGREPKTKVATYHMQQQSSKNFNMKFNCYF
jgi:hypothetical protein